MPTIGQNNLDAQLNELLEQGEISRKERNARRAPSHRSP